MMAGPFTARAALPPGRATLVAMARSSGSVPFSTMVTGVVGSMPAASSRAAMCGAAPTPM